MCRTSAGHVVTRLPDSWQPKMCSTLHMLNQILPLQRKGAVDAYLPHGRGCQLCWLLQIVDANILKQYIFQKGFITESAKLKREQEAASSTLQVTFAHVMSCCGCGMYRWWKPYPSVCLAVCLKSIPTHCLHASQWTALCQHLQLLVLLTKLPQTNQACISAHYSTLEVSGLTVSLPVDVLP